MTDIEHEYLDFVETKKTLTAQLKKKPKRWNITNCNK
jgi:hypothetical protein